VTGKPATGHVYHWRHNGISEAVAVSIEAAVACCVADSPEAAERAREVGLVKAEDLRPDITWTRNETGAITGYHVPLHPSAPAPAYARAS